MNINNLSEIIQDFGFDISFGLYFSLALYV